MDLNENQNSKKAWVVSANMGYGHQRAVYPLRFIAEESIITVGSDQATSISEAKLWKKVLGAYEFISRAKGIPFIGNPVFGVLDTFLRIPSYYPLRDLSKSTFQVDLLESSVNKGLCSAMLEKIRTKNLPMMTSFYAPAIAADMNGFASVYCIICDADLNRVWVAKAPWESKIFYFAPCGKAAQRLRAYGVPTERIYTTGFPLPVELLGDKDLSTLKANLRKRLLRLDPAKKFRARHGKNVEFFIGEQGNLNDESSKLTIMYSVGGAGAQKEIGGKIALSLKTKILSGQVKLILAAGVKSNIAEYFEDIKKSISDSDNRIEIIYANNLTDYFDKFNRALHSTDILWTKPSELSFYCALGLPIIMTSSIGSQEKFNAKWLYEVQAGIKQDNPDYTDQWLFDLLNKGRLAEAAWFGFLKARKLGTFKIVELISTGKISFEESPVMR
jgi:hypothetical protein